MIQPLDLPGYNTANIKAQTWAIIHRINLIHEIRFNIIFQTRTSCLEWVPSTKILSTAELKH